MEYNSIINRRLTEEEELHSSPDQQIVRQVITKILKGGSDIRAYLESGSISIADIVKAIKYKRCLRTPDQDFGTTYLEQIIGTAIRQTIPVDHINHARILFGLHKLPPSELIKKKKEEIV